MKILFSITIIAIGIVSGCFLRSLFYIFKENLLALSTLKRYGKIYEAYARATFDYLFNGKPININRQKRRLCYLKEKRNRILRVLKHADIQDPGVRILERVADDLFDYKIISLFENFLKLEVHNDIRIFSEFNILLEQALQFYKKKVLERIFLCRFRLFYNIFVKNF